MSAFALLRASHLPPAAAVTAIAAALAASAGRGTGVVAVALAVACGQLSVGWTNDYVDRTRDRLAHRLDKPLAAGLVAPAAVRRAAILGAAACVPLSMLSGWRAGLVHLVAVAAAMAYNFGIKGTIVSPLPYAIAFGLLPAFITLGLPSHGWPPGWASFAGAALGCGAHFVNTLGDIDADLSQGVRGLPQRLGRARSLTVGVALIAAAATTLTFAPSGDTSVVVALLFVATVALVVGIAITSRRGCHRIAWPLTIAAALTAVATLIANGDALS
jgi:4-hydroxybenzoate polyprenyltransferase